MGQVITTYKLPWLIKSLGEISRFPSNLGYMDAKALGFATLSNLFSEGKIQGNWTQNE